MYWIRVLLLMVELYFMDLRTRADAVKAFRYKDNKSVLRWVEGKNGYAKVTIDSYFPDIFSVCFRGLMEWERMGYIGWLDINLMIPEVRVKRWPNDFSIHSGRNDFYYVGRKNDKSKDSQGSYFTNFRNWSTTSDFPSQNLLRKWNHLCTSLDSTENTITF